MNMTLILLKIRNLIFYTVYYDGYNYEAIYNVKKKKQAKKRKTNKQKQIKYLYVKPGGGGGTRVMR